MNLLRKTSRPERALKSLWRSERRSEEGRGRTAGSDPARPPFRDLTSVQPRSSPEGEGLAAGDGATTMDLRRPCPLMGDAPRSGGQTPSRRRIRGVEAGSEPATVVAGDYGEGGAPDGPCDDKEPQGGGSAYVEEQPRRDGTGRRPLRPGFVATAAGVACGAVGSGDETTRPRSKML